MYRKSKGPKISFYTFPRGSRGFRHSHRRLGPLTWYVQEEIRPYENRLETLTSTPFHVSSTKLSDHSLRPRCTVLIPMFTSERPTDISIGRQIYRKKAQYYFLGWFFLKDYFYEIRGSFTLVDGSQTSMGSKYLGWLFQCHLSKVSSQNN